jgi:hypothetical protein
VDDTCTTPHALAGTEMFKGKKSYFILFLILISKKIQSPPSPDGTVVHDGSSVGAGGLEHDRATSQHT